MKNIQKFIKNNPYSSETHNQYIAKIVQAYREDDKESYFHIDHYLQTLVSVYRRDIVFDSLDEIKHSESVSYFEWYEGYQKYCRVKLYSISSTNHDKLVKYIEFFRQVSSNQTINDFTRQKSLIKDFVKQYPYIIFNIINADMRNSIGLKFIDEIISWIDDLNIVDKSNGYNLIHAAAIKGNIDLVQKFIKFKVDINHQNNMELSALELILLDHKPYNEVRPSRTVNKFDIARLLISNGAEFDKFTLINLAKKLSAICNTKDVIDPSVEFFENELLSLRAIYKAKSINNFVRISKDPEVDMSNSTTLPLEVVRAITSYVTECSIVNKIILDRKPKNISGFIDMIRNEQSITHAR